MAGPDLLQDYMSDEDYQRIRGCGPRTTSRERKSGRGPTYIRLGKRVLYYVPGVEEYIASLQVKPRQKPRTRRSAAANPRLAETNTPGRNPGASRCATGISRTA